MTILRRLIERNLRSYRQLRHFPLTLVHCRVKLQCYLARSGYIQAHWGRIVFSKASRSQLCPDDHRRHVWRRPGQRADPAFTIAFHIDPQQGFIVSEPDLSPIEYVWDMMGRRLHLPVNIDELAQQLEKLGKKYCRRPSEFVITMPRRVAACIQARGGSTSY
ncbi:transposable element Tc1 transposase [Trichonephila clavipes]|nr:transposable element Tc1 transposase [Trichonephila clavipes]